MTLVAMTYFSAGYQKLLQSGLSWVFSENMLIVLTSRTEVSNLALWIAKTPYLPQIMGAFALFTQLLALVFLCVKKLRWAFVAFPLFHIGTYVIMGADGNFIPYISVFLVFVPWEKYFRLA